MNATPRILVLTLSFGSGHPQAAQAIAKELKHQAPHAEVSVMDALKDCRFAFRACYEWPYWLMLRYAPGLWDRFSAARTKQKHECTAPSWAFRFGCPKVFETIKNFKPDVIVAAEVAACEMAVIARRLGITRASIVNVITDYEAEPIWVKAEVDVFTVADENVRTELIDWGAPAERISIRGIPIDAAFETNHDEIATRLRHGINDDFPLVLLMGGGMGPTRMDQVVRQLAVSNLPMHLIAITGHDKRIRRRLQRIRATSPVTLRVLDWTDEVPALMQAASILVTKPGGLTMVEAALCSLPVVLFDPIPGAEYVNARRMVNAGAAVMTDGPQETAEVVASLLGNEPSRRRMSLSARKVSQPNARREIAQIALELTTPASSMASRRTA